MEITSSNHPFAGAKRLVSGFREGTFPEIFGANSFSSSGNPSLFGTETGCAGFSCARGTDPAAVSTLTTGFSGALRCFLWNSWVMMGRNPSNDFGVHIVYASKTWASSKKWSPNRQNLKEFRISL